MANPNRTVFRWRQKAGFNHKPSSNDEFSKRVDRAVRMRGKWTDHQIESFLRTGEEPTNIVFYPMKKSKSKNRCEARTFICSGELMAEYSVNGSGKDGKWFQICGPCKAYLSRLSKLKLR